MASILNKINPYYVALVGYIGFDLSMPYINRKITNMSDDTKGDIQRVKMTPLENLKSRFQAMNFDFYNITGVCWHGLIFSKIYDDYWIDEVGYKMSQKKFSEIIESTHTLHNMCLEATELAISDDEILTRVFDIPQDIIPLIRESWKQKEVDLLSRYDFLMGKHGQLFFLECNGDTPSGIVEAGPAQREWADFHKLSQFNTLEDNLSRGVKYIFDKYKKKFLFMFENDNAEDSSTLKFLASLLRKDPTIPITILPIHQITETIKQAMTNKVEGDVVDPTFQNSLFWRQYPLEWLASEDTRDIFTDPAYIKCGSQTMIEPAWKIVMSNKAMSVLLKAMYPECQLLIESSLAPLSQGSAILSKQKYAREGEHIEYSEYESKAEVDDLLIDSYGGYVHPPIFQRFMPSDRHINRYLTISSWVVQGQPSGLLLREDLSKIIGTGSSVVPHFLEASDENPIYIQVEDTENQQKIRNLVYPMNSKQSIPTNNPLIQIQARTQLIKDSKRSNSEVKAELMNQYALSCLAKQHILEQSKDLFSEIQLQNKNNPILIGFAPQRRDIQSDSTGQPEEKGSSQSHSSFGYGGIGNSQGSSLDNSIPVKNSPKAGSTGRVYSSHS